MRRPEDNSDNRDEKPKQKPENMSFNMNSYIYKNTYEMINYNFLFLPVPISEGRPWTERISEGRAPTVEPLLLEALSSRLIFTSMSERR